MNYHIIAGINYPHRIAIVNSINDINDWCKKHKYTYMPNLDRKIGNQTTEVVVIPNSSINIY